jgi:uncharacterized protein
MSLSAWPGYYLSEAAAPPPAPVPLRTDVAGFAGQLPTLGLGATGADRTGPVLVTDVADFDRLAGPVEAAEGHLAAAVHGYFDNGGQLAYVAPVGPGPPGRDAYADAARSLLDQPEVALLVLPDLWVDLGEAAPELVAWLAGEADGLLDRMLVLDLPQAASRSASEAAAVLDRLDQVLPDPPARAVALYHPWTLVEAGRGGAGAALAPVPPGGQVAGVISRLDRERGPSRSPANETLADAVDLDLTRDSMPEAELAGRRVNPITCVPGRGLRVWGARTFHREPAGRFVAHRRLLHRLVRAARQAAAPLVFEPDGPELRLALARALGTVLLQAFRSGALAGRTASEAFTVVCDDTTTTPADTDAGRVVAEVQLRHANPMEVIRVVLGLAAEGRLEVVER